MVHLRLSFRSAGIFTRGIDHHGHMFPNEEQEQYVSHWK